MADPEVDWGVDDDFDPWAHPDPESGRGSQSGIDPSSEVVDVGVGNIPDLEPNQQTVASDEQVDGAATPVMDHTTSTSNLPPSTWLTLSSHSHPNQPYYVNLSTLQTSWIPPSPSSLEQNYDLSGIRTPPLSTATTTESVKKSKRGIKENGKDTRPLIERLAPLPAAFQTQSGAQDEQKEAKEYREEKAEDEAISSQSPAQHATLPPAVASTSTTAPEPPRTISLPNPTTTALTLPPKGPRAPLRDRLTLPDSYRPDSPSSVRPVVVKADSYRPGMTGGDRGDRERGRDGGRDGSRDVGRELDRGRSRDNPGWYDRSRPTERPNTNRRNSRSRSMDPRDRPRLDERDRRDGMDERIRDRPPHDLRSQPVGIAVTKPAIKEDNVIARDRRGQPLVTRRIDAPPTPITNNAPNRVGSDRPPHLDRSMGGVQNRAVPSPSVPRSSLGQPPFPMTSGEGRPPSGPSTGGNTSQPAINNRWGPRGTQGPPTTNGSNVAPSTSAGLPRAARWSMADSNAPQSAVNASPARAAFGASAVPPGRDAVEKRRGDAMARDDSVKRARVEDGRRDEPRTERRWGARKDDDPSPSTSQGVSTDPSAARPQSAATEQQPAGPSASPARAVFVHPSRQLNVPAAAQGAPPPRREDPQRIPNVPRGPANNFQQSPARPPPFSGPRRGGPPAQDSGRGRGVPAASANAVPVAPRDTRGRAAYEYDSKY